MPGEEAQAVTALLRGWEVVAEAARQHALRSRTRRGRGGRPRIRASPALFAVVYICWFVIDVHCINTRFGV